MGVEGEREALAEGGDNFLFLAALWKARGVSSSPRVVARVPTAQTCSVSLSDDSTENVEGRSSA
jgi:hypothetical protein